ncbi:hypothetical protein [Ottowia oryzae]|uniref:Uncharacterized protein n=1 Tax=Ottowia oryzae TaxID=2109914 RepID=A0A2S0MCS6_9BURK|nr:hypothetical protein [Ottowia oryzae]AVO33692.1 hypothetical protein C6570_05030 [Ottowia oryzae]
MAITTHITNNGRLTVVTVVGVRGPQGGPGGGGNAPAISADPDNRIREGSDGGLHVLDNLIPDPLAYYILAKG